MDAVNMEASGKAYDDSQTLASSFLNFIGKDKMTQYTENKNKYYKEAYEKQYNINKELLKSCRPAYVIGQLQLRSELIEEKNKINKIMNKLRGDLKFVTKALNEKIDFYKESILKMAEKEKNQYELAKKKGKLAVYNYKMLKAQTALAETDCKEFAAQKQREITQLFNDKYRQQCNNAERDKYITIGYALLTNARRNGIQSAIIAAEFRIKDIKSSGLIRDANKENINFIVSRVSYYKQVTGGKWESKVDIIRKEIYNKWHQRYD